MKKSFKDQIDIEIKYPIQFLNINQINSSDIKKETKSADKIFSNRLSITKQKEALKNIFNQKIESYEQYKIVGGQVNETESQRKSIYRKQSIKKL